MKRSAVVRDLHSPKYRQRIVRDRRRVRHHEAVEDDALDSGDIVGSEYSSDLNLAQLELDNGKDLPD